jgi:hypothetical protein
MAQFENDYDFVLATPDGRPPQLDVNGLALNFHAAETSVSPPPAPPCRAGVERFSPEKLREKNPDLLKRRESELALAHRLLGRIPVSEPLPKTDAEAVSVRDDVVATSRHRRSASTCPSRTDRTAPRSRLRLLAGGPGLRAHARRTRPDGRLPRQPVDGGVAPHPARGRRPDIPHLPCPDRPHLGALPGRRRRQGHDRSRPRLQGRTDHHRGQVRREDRCSRSVPEGARRTHAPALLRRRGTQRTRQRGLRQCRHFLLRLLQLLRRVVGQPG